MSPAVLITIAVCLSIIVLVEVRIRQDDAKRRQQRRRDHEIIRRMVARNRRRQ